MAAAFIGGIPAAPHTAYVRPSLGAATTTSTDHDDSTTACIGD